MRAIDLLLNSPVTAVMTLFLAVIWMLRDEKDKVRAELVFALVLNLFYGVLFNIFMVREGGIFPWKFDHVLYCLDTTLGVQAASIVRPLEGRPHILLWAVYQSMIPMMIAWFLLIRYRRISGSIILSYITELVVGPLLYTIVPACGPIYAFKKQWLHPPVVAPVPIRLAGMPNAFPSLHVGTAFVFLMFAPGRIWKVAALLFLAATCLATLSTGEHYVIDLIAGLAFGAFVSAVGMRNFRRAGGFLALTLVWSLGVRFAYATLIAHPMLTRSMAEITVIAAIVALYKQWSAKPEPVTGCGIAA
jgi:hypothetical protein